MHFWAECFNPNVLCQLFNPDRGLRAGRSVVRGKGRTLLIAQRLDGVEFGSLIGWLETEKDAYSDRNAAS